MSVSVPVTLARLLMLVPFRLNWHLRCRCLYRFIEAGADLTQPAHEVLVPVPVYLGTGTESLLAPAYRGMVGRTSSTNYIPQNSGDV